MCGFSLLDPYSMASEEVDRMSYCVPRCRAGAPARAGRRLATARSPSTAPGALWGWRSPWPAFLERTIDPNIRNPKIENVLRNQPKTLYIIYVSKNLCKSSRIPKRELQKFIINHYKTCCLSRLKQIHNCWASNCWVKFPVD